MKIKDWFYLTMLKFIAGNMDIALKNTDKMSKEERESFNRIKDGLNKVKEYQDNK